MCISTRAIYFDKEIHIKVVISPECDLTLDRQGFSKSGAMHLLEACDGYLALYKEVFTDPGYLPNDSNNLDEAEENLFAIATWAKSNLFKAHAAELDVYAKKISSEIA